MFVSTFGSIGLVPVEHILVPLSFATWQPAWCDGGGGGEDAWFCGMLCHQHEGETEEHEYRQNRYHAE